MFEKTRNILFGYKTKLLADQAKLGRWGEKTCEKFLKEKGLKSLTRNFTCRTGEIDLVMAEVDGTIVFVEVKTRANEDFKPAELSVNKSKQDRLFSAAKYFLQINDIENRPLRFDIVTVILDSGGKTEIRHYQNAFVH